MRARKRSSARRPGLTPAERAGWEQTYARTAYEKLPWYSAMPSPWLVAAVTAGRLKRGGSILDVGCGAGSNIIWLAQEGYRTFGVDIAPSAVEAARERAERAGVDVDLRVADATALPFSRGAFDALTDSGCFHSLPFRLRKRYATEVARVVRPKGTFLLTWIGREETRSYGPPHRPSLNEVTEVLEPTFVFESTEYHGPESPGGWGVPQMRLGRYTAILRRRQGPQPRPR